MYRPHQQRITPHDEPVIWSIFRTDCMRAASRRATSSFAIRSLILYREYRYSGKKVINERPRRSAIAGWRERSSTGSIVSRGLLAKGKPKYTATRGPVPASKPVGGMAIAAGWPIYEVLLSRGWDEQGAAITLLSARCSPNLVSWQPRFLLVDLACLGVKSAQVHLFKHVGEYDAGLRAHALHLQPMMPVDLNLAARIVFTGLEYSGNLGFRPDLVYTQAAHLLAGADPEADPTSVPMGEPLYINGLRDDIDERLKDATRNMGA